MSVHPRPAPTGWTPFSPCHPDRCLPAASDEAGWARRAGRLLSAAFLVLCGLAFSPVLLVVSRRRRHTLVSAGARMLLRALGIRLTVAGSVVRPGGRAVLYVGNHGSWIDILTMVAIQPCRHVAKASIRRWPVVGPIAAAAGSVWMERDKLSKLPATIDAASRALRMSGALAGFPEGTTWCGQERGPFKPALFEAAVRAGAVVQPVALRFGDTRMAFVGDDSLAASLWRAVSLRRPTVEAIPTAALDATVIRSRRELAALASSSIASALTDGRMATMRASSASMVAMRPQAPSYLTALPSS
ncbi:lysophospholipid acyltransferase family protein [Fodinicola acaciae]|uniref:lysophospholipid acyltransferase family protein n=1 Tax=Fodinicola acaciae TaxID=2681555 RepID=UPI0013D693B6|nr:lysophospholipid acyltransferase family protein [Fodinicola acaciae]